MKEIRVRIADLAISASDAVLTTVGLGSCVAIALYDPAARVGGLAHILLPSESLSPDRCNRAKFPGTAVPLLVERMCARGARAARITGRLVGGASMFPGLGGASGLVIGERNVIASRQALTAAGIPLVGEDVGGAHGRSVFFRVCDGRIDVRSLTRGDVSL